MIETIFLLVGLRRDLRDDLGRPGPRHDQPRLPDLSSARCCEYDVGGASAGGVIAVVLANIVAVFLVRTDRQEPRRLRARPCSPRPATSSVLTIVGWVVAVLIFFPIFWMVLTSFKTEIEAVATPPKLFFTPTLENYVAVRERADYVHFALNSVVISVGATLLAIADRRARRLRDGVLPDASGPRTCCCGCCRPR